MPKWWGKFIRKSDLESRQKTLQALDNRLSELELRVNRLEKRAQVYRASEPNISE